MSIDEFSEKIIGLRPNNFMALNGAGAGIIGSADSGTQVLIQLQQSALAFAQLYKAGQAKPNDLQTARRELTGKIMVAVTMDAITEQTADELLDELQQLMKERKR